MSQPTCKTCAYWGARIVDVPDLRRCEYTHELRLWITYDERGEVLAPGHESILAFTQDADSFSSELVTKAEFGCVAWKPTSTSTNP